jgi:hypothetical protein
MDEGRIQARAISPQTNPIVSYEAPLATLSGIATEANF